MIQTCLVLPHTSSYWVTAALLFATSTKDVEVEIWRFAVLDKWEIIPFGNLIIHFTTAVTSVLWETPHNDLVHSYKGHISKSYEINVSASKKELYYNVHTCRVLTKETYACSLLGLWCLKVYILSKCELVIYANFLISGFIFFPSNNCDWIRVKGLIYKSAGNHRRTTHSRFALCLFPFLLSPCS